MKCPEMSTKKDFISRKKYQIQISSKSVGLITKEGELEFGLCLKIQNKKKSQCSILYARVEGFFADFFRFFVCLFFGTEI
jgi:hypothetical protein